MTSGPTPSRSIWYAAVAALWTACCATLLFAGVPVAAAALAGMGAGLAGSAAARRIRHRSEHAELAAIHSIVLAGVSGGSLAETVSRIVASMARTLRYRHFAIGLVEQTESGPILRCAGAWGHPAPNIGRVLPLGEGICGTTAATGQSQIVRDTREDPRYVEWVDGARSEVCVPILAGDRVIGVLDVESPAVGAFGRNDVEHLELLAPQIGLVITNAHLLEHERATAGKVRELERMRADFVSITSHELRTPLTSLSGFLSTLRRIDITKNPRETVEYLDVMDRQVRRLTTLIEDLLLVTRIEHNELTMTSSPINVSALLESLKREREQTQERIRVDADPSLPSLMCDGQQLARALRHVIDNALRFSPEDTAVTVRSRRDGSHIAIDVVDFGPGIPADDLDRIFEPFRQADPAARAVHGGMGLGLYITRWLVEAMGGSITVRSSEVGTTVTLRLQMLDERALTTAS